MELITDNNVPVLRFEEDVIFGRSNRLKNKAKQLIRENEINKLVVDIKEVGFIDSSGIGMLISLFKNLREKKGEMVICGPSDKVKKVIKLTMLDKIITIYDNEEEAVNHFTGRGE